MRTTDNFNNDDPKRTRPADESEYDNYEDDDDFASDDDSYDEDAAGQYESEDYDENDYDTDEDEDEDYDEDEYVPWYKSNWFTGTCMAVFPPYAIYRIWKDEKFSTTNRWLITAIDICWMLIMLVLLFSFIFGRDRTPNNPADAGVNVVANVTANPDATPDANNAQAGALPTLIANGSTTGSHTTANPGAASTTNPITGTSEAGTNGIGTGVSVGNNSGTTGTSAWPGGSASSSGWNGSTTTNTGDAGSTGSAANTGSTANTGGVGNIGSTGNTTNTGSTGNATNTGNIGGSIGTGTSSSNLPTTVQSGTITTGNTGSTSNIPSTGGSSTVDDTNTGSAATSSPIVSTQTVWYNDDGIYYHSTRTCGGTVSGTSSHPLSDAEAAGKRRCPYCYDGVERPGSGVAVVTERPVVVTARPTATPVPTAEPTPKSTSPYALSVYYTGPGVYYHSRSNCLGMNGAELHTIGEAIDAGKKRCPYCSAPEPGASATPAPTPEPTPEVHIVWYTDDGMYYHAISSCTGMTGATKHTLGEAIDSDKRVCPVCNPPTQN